MKWRDLRLALVAGLAALTVILAGCSEKDSPTIAAMPVAGPDLAETARRLAAGPVDSDSYGQLLYLSEEARRELRDELMALMSQESIEDRDDIFAVIGPSEGSYTTAETANTLAQLEMAISPTKSMQSAWYLYVHVPFYSQNDPHWKNKALGFNYCGDSTIGRYGCHLCCIAMLYAKWGYPQMSPPGLDDWRRGGRSHYAFSTSQCGDLIRLPHSLEYPGMCRPWRYLRVDEIWGQLAAGRPVVSKTDQYKGSHFVVLFGHDGSRYWVKDPVKDAARQNQPLSGRQYDFRLYGAI